MGQGPHVKSDRQLVPPCQNRASPRAPVKLSNAETALSKQQPRPAPYYPALIKSEGRLYTQYAPVYARPRARARRLSLSPF